MENDTLEQLRAAFAVLADENRLRIIGLIAQRAHSVEELAALLQLKEPTVSHHLNRMKALNLVTMDRQGNTHLYRLDADALRAVQKSVFALGAPSDVSAAIAPAAYDDKVLASFFDGERLVSIPSSRKKRLVVLRRLIAAFDETRGYLEAEVNAVLKRAHDDVATLRREFIINHMMTRADGVYCRTPVSDWQIEDGSQVRA
ncbi:MAG: metalloregulator ArsR/SmtB family transcription factor [Deltaproteobacteria bacterium]